MSLSIKNAAFMAKNGAMTTPGVMDFSWWRLTLESGASMGEIGFLVRPIWLESDDSPAKLLRVWAIVLIVYMGLRQLELL